MKCFQNSNYKNKNKCWFLPSSCLIWILSWPIGYISVMMTILRSVTKASTTLGTPIWFNQRSMFSSVLKKRLWCSSHTWINLAAYWLPVNLSRTRRTIPCLPLYKCSNSYQCTNKWRYLTIYIVFLYFLWTDLFEWMVFPTFLSPPEHSNNPPWRPLCRGGA